jgi:outer membrane beta-barrel protein
MSNAVMAKRHFIIIFAAMFLFAAHIFAEEINIPSDELARDSVYPVFDSRAAVKNRNVKDSGTFDFGIFGGMAITEPIYNATKLGVALNYHFNEVHSLGLLAAKNTVGLSKDAEGLKEDFHLDFTRAPYPVSSLLLDYNYKLYYGKLSVTKNGVINTSIYYSGSAGTIQYIHKSYPAIAIGVGERFYLTNSLALKVDLRLFANEAPVPFKANALRDSTSPSPDPIPSYDSFSDRMTLTTELGLGLNYLF